MQSSTFTLTASDGAKIHIHRWLPDGEVRGIVQIAHGVAEHAGRYAHVAEALTATGYAVYGDDHRGHGLTAQTPDELGFFADSRGWARVLDDLYRLNRTARDAHPGVPAYLLGHSLGSYLTQQFLFTFPEAIDGAAMSGSSRQHPLKVEAGAALAEFELRRLGPHGRSDRLETIPLGLNNRAFEPARTPMDWLSRDPDIVDAYLADPLCGFVSTVRLWLDVANGLRVTGQRARLATIPPNLPIYLFSGAEDPLGGAGGGLHRLVDAYERAGLLRVTLRLHPGGRHEILNETNRDEVISELIAWLDARTREATDSR